VLGDRNVGKTSIIDLYTKDDFRYDTYQTYGIDFFYKKKTFDNLEYKFKILDTPGSSYYSSLTSTAIQISNGYFMVFAVDDIRSFKKAIYWINFIEDHINLEEKVLYWLGNKIDEELENRQVTKEEAELFAKSKNFKYFETSARTKIGINEAFEEMFKDVYEMYKKNNEKNTNDHLEKNKKNNKKKAKDHFEKNKKENKKNINNHLEMNKKDNKNKSNYSQFSNSNYILKKYTNY